MATPRVKTTYSLPVETVAALDRLSVRWGVSRSEALVRAVAAAEETGPPTEALIALDAWQAAAALEDSRAMAWERSVRAERRARDVAGERSTARVAERPRD
jgi:hypothetical protein